MKIDQIGPNPPEKFGLDVKKVVGVVGRGIGVGAAAVGFYKLK